MDAPNYITQAQAARRLGTSHTNVGRLIALNRLAPIIVERTIMVPTDQVDAEKAAQDLRRSARKAEA